MSDEFKFEFVPFHAPSPELLEMLRQIEEMRSELERITGVGNVPPLAR